MVRKKNGKKQKGEMEEEDGEKRGKEKLGVSTHFSPTSITSVITLHYLFPDLHFFLK